MQLKTGTKGSVHILLAVTLVLSLSSCSYLRQLGLNGEQYRPRVSFQSVSVRAIDWRKVDLDFNFRIDNPNPLSVRMASFNWSLDVAGKRALQGQNNEGIALKANGASTFRIPVSLTFARVFELAGALQGRDNVPYALAGQVGFSTPMGMLRAPLVKRGTMPVLHKPSFALAGMRMGRLNLLAGRASVFIDIDVANKTGGSALAFNGFDYTFKIGGKGAVSGRLDNLASVAAGAVKRVSLPVNFNLGALGMTLVSALKSKATLPVTVDAKMLVKTPFGDVPLSIAQGRKLAAF